ncbi:MAG TPA: hypothetical protein VNQ80_14100 [Parapedobacter sp.]|uniref:hypothetical protein n=1 Tax=Parapedobacter sp. TaxID=1958893 RepID=UPI002CBB47AB|nr:hypothetical protein [Parapedobacter sp.]HWK58472.1 hypothetical protein [Parapedobacter sp.]
MNRNRRAIVLLVCVMGSATILGVLFCIRPLRPNEQYLGFSRFFAAKPVELVTLRLPAHDFYLAGKSEDSLYLGNHRKAMHVWQVDLGLLDMTSVPIWSDRFAYEQLALRVQGDYFYVLDGVKPFIRYGRRGQWWAHELMDSAFFLQAAPTSDRGLVMLGMVNSENALGKWQDGMTNPKWRTDLLEKQVDGFFCTYGKLHTDEAKNRVVYIYTNRNQFLVADTNLNVHYWANTIDTISRAKIRVGHLDSLTSTLASPPLPVNVHSALDGNLLYVHSNIMAANEDRSDFEQHIVIDVYDLDERGSYQYSFYIPKISMKPFKGFLVKRKKLFALFGDELVGYGL